MERVGERFGDEAGDMVIGGPVVDVVALAAAVDDAGPAELGEVL